MTIFNVDPNTNYICSSKIFYKDDYLTTTTLNVTTDVEGEYV